jgi:hypothetical protein
MEKKREKKRIPEVVSYIIPRRFMLSVMFGCVVW